MTPRGIVLVGYVVIGLFLWPTAFIALPATQGDPPPLRTFHINNQVACLDGAGGGTEQMPFCTLRHVASWWRAGDLFLLHSPRDGSGPVEFTRGGTATAPITLRGVGGRPVIGNYTDVDDAAFVAVPEMPGVFRLPGAPAGMVWQTKFPGILVDDPNQSIYTMVDTDGPLQLAYAPDEATLAKVEGTYRGGLEGLRVHPYGSQPPSVSSSDFVVGQGRALNFGSGVNYLRFENLTITYAGSVYSFQVNGTGHIFRNVHWYGVPLNIKGTGSLVEHYKIAHVHTRDASGEWLWHLHGTGTAGIVGGSGHRLINGEILHSWNAEISSELAKGLQIENLRTHGSPNHCGAGRQGDTTVRNWVAFNCQDYVWLPNPQRATLEHVVVAGGGINVEALTVPMGPVILRNIITKGKFTYVRGPMENCTWEKQSVFENSIIDTSASIERCEGTVQKTYPFQEYMDKCASGALTGCMTMRNIKIIPVDQWPTVLKDGMWSPALGDTWDVSLPPGSPARNLGASTTKVDILGVPRPQPVGGLSDAGIYEVSDDKPKPVDCVVSEWSPWAATGPPTFANWAQTLTQSRTRTISTPPASGGAACPALTESRTVAQPCETITVTPSLQITCNVSAPGVQKK